MIRILAVLLRWPWWRDDESGRYADLAAAKVDRTSHPRLPRLS